MTNLSEYEKKRLENVKRNQMMLAALNIPKLASATKKTGAKTASAYPKKKESKESTTLIPLRSSKRLKQEPAELVGVDDPETLAYIKTSSSAAPSLSYEKPRIEGDVDVSMESDLAVFSAAPPPKRTEKYSSIDDWFSRMKIQSDSHVVKMTPSRIYSMMFHPTADKPIAFAGDKLGNFGIWDIEKHASEPGQGITQIRTHAESISCLHYNPINPLQLYTAAYDGVIRCFDMSKMVFREILRVKDALFTHLQILEQDANIIYFSNMDGELCQYDVRTASSSTASFTTYLLHEKKMSSFSINPIDSNLMATSSNDRTLTFWDRRKLKPFQSDILAQIEHKNAVTCAYFCPHDGSKLVSNCYDDTIRLYSDIVPSKILSSDSYNGPTLKTAIHHNNKTGKWITPFKAQWGSSLFDGKEPYFVMGNMNKTMDVFSGIDGSQIATLDDEKLTAQPAVNAIHRHQAWLTSGTGSGRAYFWSIQ